MEFKGTKGEWYVGEYAGSVKAKGVKGLLATAWSVYDAGKTEIRKKGESWLDMRHRTASIRDLKEMEAQANAKLIAAAPDLLDALQHGLRLAESLSNKESIAVRMFIKKAKLSIEKALV